jgi:predicted RNase H-like HicB family nuclease
MSFFSSRKIPFINLAIIYEQDPDTGFYIAHFEQFPDTYAQGETKDEAMKNVCKALKAVLELEQAEKSTNVQLEINMKPAKTSRDFIKLQLVG